MGANLAEIDFCCCRISDDFVLNQLENSNLQFLKNPTCSKMVTLNGLQYVGEGFKNQVTGKGALFKEFKGVYYEGDIRQGKADGKGTLKIQDVEGINVRTYEGMFKDNCAHTFGENEGTYSTNSIYFKGKWTNGFPQSGRLLLKQKNEQILLKKINIDSQAIYIEVVFKIDDSSDKFQYYGNIAKFGNIYLYQGKGTIIKNKGANKQESYVGNWCQGEMDGYGEYTWPNGEKYQGFYEKGQRNGKGKYYISKDRYFEGEWVNGQRNGLFTLREGNHQQPIYQNQFINNRPKLLYEI